MHFSSGNFEDPPDPETFTPLVMEQLEGTLPLTENQFESSNPPENIDTEQSIPEPESDSNVSRRYELRTHRPPPERYSK